MLRTLSLTANPITPSCFFHDLSLQASLSEILSLPVAEIPTFELRSLHWLDELNQWVETFDLQSILMPETVHVSGFSLRVHENLSSPPVPYPDEIERHRLSTLVTFNEEIILIPDSLLDAGMGPCHFKIAFLAMLPEAHLHRWKH